MKIPELFAGKASFACPSLLGVRDIANLLAVIAFAFTLSAATVPSTKILPLICAETASQLLPVYRHTV